MNMEEFKERYEELKNNPMYQKYCSVLETKDKVINKLKNQLEKLTQENNDLEERVIHQDNVIKQLTNEKEELKTKLTMEEMLCFSMPEETQIVCLTKPNYERNKLEYETLDKYKSVIDKAIEYIEHSWWLRTDQVYDTSKDLKDWEVKELLEILRSKE